MSQLTVSLEGAAFCNLNANDHSLKRVVFLVRDPGGWNTLLSVIIAMAKAGVLNPCTLASGWAVSALRKTAFPEELNVRFRPHAPELLWVVSRAAAQSHEVWKPSLFVTAGSWSDHHLEVAARELYPDVPMLYVENNYGQYAKLFAELKRRGLALPEKACCIDHESQKDLIGAYVEYDSDRSVVTGSPAFDRFADEQSVLRRGARKKLGLEDNHLVTFMGTPACAESVRALAKALAARNWGMRPIFAVRRHPCDETPAAKYAEHFDSCKLEYLETEAFDTDTVGLASSLVLTTRSTEATHAVRRGIPVIYVVDRRYLKPEAATRFPLPPARLGAAAHCESVEDAAMLAQMLTDHQSPLGGLGLRSAMFDRMEMHYLACRFNAKDAVMSEIGAKIARSPVS